MDKKKQKITMGTTRSYPEPQPQQPQSQHEQQRQVKTRGPYSKTCLQGKYEIANNIITWKNTVVKADIQTFEDLGAGWARDRTRVMYCGKPIENADPVSFRVNTENRCFASDRLRSYYRGKLIT